MDFDQHRLLNSDLFIAPDTVRLDSRFWNIWKMCCVAAESEDTLQATISMQPGTYDNVF